ncbi:SPRY domain-containing protein 3 isoform X2 [Eurytemora carolleeae]|uniref:SPRY domain-containing protein 3 isoform X2 n=1 Tax=Eurytemora carolleeae TaxID=1294199 RepID=UPI000C793A4E|nr:SPRY domain-containing protein 3 isoform X2 [Eurytemora carolleeae]|eukprot:XP_023326347.1 SPRY domain-containing protein 3-like isoform X2 [Eurytemora affinis]
MDHRLIQPASRDQIVAIIRQRAERANRDIPVHLGQAVFDRDIRAQLQAALPPEEELKPRLERLIQTENNFKYAGDKGSPGTFIAGIPLSPEKPYFELELVNAGNSGVPVCGPIIGLCSHKYPLDLLPGWSGESIGLNTADGKIYKGRPRGQVNGGKFMTGDRVGCGVKFENISGLNVSLIPVFFTKNGKEICTTFMPCPPGGLFPAFGLQKEPEEVRLMMDLVWNPEDDVAMSIDSGEEEWHRLHDIRLNGQLLEYVGRGKSLIDVGLAQAKTPLCTRSHYFEIEIIDPGSNCYIAIGLARKDYPKNRHPGWNKGSIAYHADDGKVFMGSGVGDPFGPRCNKGDIMGCGVLFPRDYEFRSDSEEEEEGESLQEVVYSLGEETDSGDEDDYWQPNNKQGEKIQVFFTRNGKVIGKKDVFLPKGGFYPTVGMMSSQEKVRVELRPLSG